MNFLGRGYLKKFRFDVREQRTFLMTADNVKSFQEQEITIPQWIGKVKTYLMNVQGHLIEKKSMVIMIESQIFLTYTQPPRQVCFIVSRKKQQENI